MNCGQCGNMCDLLSPAVPECFNGTCRIKSCSPGFKDCNGIYADGCEINTDMDTENCGACDNDCNDSVFGVVSPQCMGGTCDFDMCADGYSECDSHRENGCESITTVSQCGLCNNDCNNNVENAEIPSCNPYPSPHCDYDTCRDGYLDCNPFRDDGCESMRDVTRCTDSCIMCEAENADAICTTDNECDYTDPCSFGYLDCDSNRANGCEKSGTTLTDCGMCEHTCDAVVNVVNVLCSFEGECEYDSCQSGYLECDTHLYTGCEQAEDYDHCGPDCSSCTGKLANVDPPFCDGGACTTNAGQNCMDGFGDCDTDPATGCELDLSSDPANCGGCHITCSYTCSNSHCSD